MAKVKNHIYVTNSETGEAGWINPGDDLPDWADGYVDEANLGDPEVEADEDGFSTEDLAQDYPALLQDGPNATSPGSTYDDLNGAELEELLRERDLPVSGTVAEKRARLMADDNANG